MILIAAYIINWQKLANGYIYTQSLPCLTWEAKKGVEICRLETCKFWIFIGTAMSTAPGLTPHLMTTTFGEKGLWLVSGKRARFSIAVPKVLGVLAFLNLSGNCGLKCGGKCEIEEGGGRL